MIQSQYGDLLPECIVLWCRASVEDCRRKVLFFDMEPVCRTVAGSDSFVIESQGGDLLKEGVIF